MRRFLVTITAMLLVANFAPAQQRLVDEVKKNIGDLSATAKTFREARSKLKPALTHSSTKDKAETWWLAARVEWGLYDKLTVSKSLGQKVDSIEMGKALIDGYDHCVKALKLDTVRLTKSDGSPKIDKKTGLQQVKTKYSRDIAKRAARYLNDFGIAGSVFYNCGKWDEAYKAFAIYHQLASSPLCHTNNYSRSDTLTGQILYYQGLASIQLKRYSEAHQLLAKARSYGYTSKTVYDNDINALALAGDSVGVVRVAKEAFHQYGGGDIQYMRIMINDLVLKRNYRDADVMLDQAILRDSTNAEYFILKGNIAEIESGCEQARPYYLHAVSLDSTCAQAYQNAGRTYYLEALNYKQKHFAAAGRQSSEAIKALYMQALPLMERAHSLAPNDGNTRDILRDIYYKLGMGDKLDTLEREL